MDTLQTFLNELWWLTEEMAPWLLLGFAVAGACGTLLPEGFIERHLSGRSLGNVIKAVVIGIPLPICSCGVIPVAASLRKKGASKGSVAAFTAATPQTGVDSIAATYSLMGWIFTVGRLAANLISGILAGVLINLTDRKHDSSFEAATSLANEDSHDCCHSKQDAHTESTSGCCESSESGSEQPRQSCCSSEADSQPQKHQKCCYPGSEQDAPKAENKESCCCHGAQNQASGLGASLRKAFRDGFVTMPADIGKYLAIGIFLGALISTLIPENAMAEHLDHPLLTYLAVTIIAVPLYVCATGSIPLAFSLLEIGISPGAAIVFLVAGPATNTATVVTLFKLIGRRETFIYLGTLVAGAWIIGYVFDTLIPEDALAIASQAGEQMTGGWLGTASAIVLIAVILNAWRKRGF